MVAIREALHEIDPTISPNLPPFLMEPALIAEMFHLPLQKFNYQGGKQTGYDPAIVKQMRQFVEHLEANLKTRPSLNLNDLEQDIVDALGTDTLTGEKIAKRANRNCDSTFKAALASLRRQGILGNNNPGYYRI